MLLKYDLACRALAEAKSFDEVKDISDKALALKIYARQSHNPELEADMAEISLRAKRRMGELCVQLPKRQGARKDKLPPSGGGSSAPVKEDVLKEAGLSQQEASRCERLYKVDPHKFEEQVAETREKVLAGKYKHVSDRSDEWYTPELYISAVKAVLGTIDLYPASCEAAQETVGATKYFGVKDNGLIQSWLGKVFLNPPYSMPAVAKFAFKAITEFEYGNVTEAIVLTNNATDTEWFQALLEASSAVCFPNGRIKFESGRDNPLTPRQGQCFFYLGSNPGRFYQGFGALGFVLQEYKQSIQSDVYDYQQA
jgi:hypothetical protein